jgi:hypothetical protein
MVGADPGFGALFRGFCRGLIEANSFRSVGFPGGISLFRGFCRGLIEAPRTS